MCGFLIFLLALALIAGVLGFTAIAGAALTIAKVVFWIIIIITLFVMCVGRR